MNYSISPSFVANFHDFHNIPYANRLQFANFFLPNSYSQTFLPPKFLYCTVIVGTENNGPMLNPC